MKLILIRNTDLNINFNNENDDDFCTRKGNIDWICFFAS